jgi:LuxR family transcriptional regulator, maltose regulon positive regulatory protein
VDRLVAHPGPVLLVAPPGFGKTTLLGQWRLEQDRPFAWVSLDRGDNDPVVLWRYIAAAIRAVEPRLPGPVDGSLRVPGVDIVTSFVPRLLNELESLETEIVLVLDDYHAIGNPACHESVELFLHREPSNVRVVLAARSDPPLSVGRLRAGGDLLELRATDLGFTPQETERLLNKEFELGLASSAVAALHERTEGWPAGLYLAYLSMRNAMDRERFVTDFSGSSRHVVDYLTEVVLDTLDPASQDFLLRTSIVERMSGPLCDAITGRRDSAELLVELEHANLFIIPLDDRREWYRYHRLFADLLHDELHRRDADGVPELHRRASEWLAAGGHTGQAIRHALAAGQVEAAIRLVAEQYLLTIEWGGFATVASWLGYFPRGTVAGDARLSVVEAWVMSFLQRHDEARAALQNALASGYEGPLPDGASSVEASAALLRAGFPVGHVGEMLDAARRAFHLEGGRQSMWRVTANVQLGWALSLAGRFEEARPYLERAARMAPLSEQWLNAMGARCLLAWLSLDVGRLDDAERWAREALDVVRSHGLPDTVPPGWGAATLGAVLARRGGLAEGDRLLTEGIEEMRAGAEPVLLVQALLALVSIRKARGDLGTARTLLAEARSRLDGFADAGILGHRLEKIGRALTPSHQRIAADRSLTEREFEVLQLLAKGLPKREVASTLFLSYNTIHSHTRSIYRKLGATSRAEAIDHAHQQGLL